MLSIKDMSDLDRLIRFGYGLKPVIRKEVEKQEPTTLNDAMRMADKLEGYEFEQRTFSKSYDSKNDNWSHNKRKVDDNKTTTNFKNTSLEDSVKPQGSSNERKTNFSSTTYKKQPYTKNSLNENSNKLNNPSKKGPKCFNCNQFGNLSYDCPMPLDQKPEVNVATRTKTPNENTNEINNLQLVQHNEAYEHNSATIFKSMQAPCMPSQTSHKIPSILSDGIDLIKISGYVKGHPMLFLLDTGATHNFIAEKIVKKLQIRMSTMKGISVKLATRQLALCDFYVSQLPIKIGEFLDHVNFTVAPLHEHAIVWGMDWLSTNNVSIQCAKHQAILWDKINKIPLTLKDVVHDRTEEIFLSAMQIKKLIRKRHSAGLLYLYNSEVETTTPIS
jgi:hypothetical protein